MSGLKGIFKGKETNATIAKALAKNYQKKATKAFKQYLQSNSDAAKPFTGFSIPICSLSFKDRIVDIYSEPEDVFGTKCKTTDDLYVKEKFIRPENFDTENCWFISRDYEEIQDFLKALEELNYTIMWRFDKDRNNYILYPVFFVN